MSESAREHREASPDRIRIAVLTISDTRTYETDTGGNTIVESMQRAGHEVARREIVRDDAPRIEEVLAELLANESVDAVVTTGGTGISGTRSFSIARRTAFVEPGRQARNFGPVAIVTAPATARLNIAAAPISS